MNIQSKLHNFKIVLKCCFWRSAHFLTKCTQDNKHLKMFECTIECFKCTTDYLVVAFNFSFGNLPNFSVRKNGHAHRILCTRLSIEQLLDAQFESVLVDFFQFENWKHGLSPVIPGPNKNKIMQIWLLHVKVQLKIFNHTENFFDSWSFSTGNDVINNC